MNFKSLSSKVSQIGVENVIPFSSRVVAALGKRVYLIFICLSYLHFQIGKEDEEKPLNNFPILLS